MIEWGNHEEEISVFGRHFGWRDEVLTNGQDLIPVVVYHGVHVKKLETNISTHGTNCNASIFEFNNRTVMVCLLKPSSSQVKTIDAISGLGKVEDFL